MAYSSFNEIQEAAKQLGKPVVSVAAADDIRVLEAVKHSNEVGIAEFILVGNAEKIKKLAKKLEMNSSEFTIIDTPDPGMAALEATRQVSAGKADVLMKGLVNTSDFMHAVLDSQVGLKTGRIISHLAAFEIPGHDRLMFLTDGGINIAPDLNEKRVIMQNAINFLNAIGYENPMIAILSANEVINSKMPVTLEAAMLAKMAERGQITGATIDGPIPLDLALSEEAARQKNVVSPVAGKADLLFVPTIEVGNVLGKSLVYFANAVMAGIVLGTKAPVILTSRAATMDMKIASLALAVLSKSKKVGKSDVVG